MSNWPRNHADLSHPNWTARTCDRRKDVDWKRLEMKDRIPLSAWLGAAAFIFVLFWLVPSIAIMAGFF